MDAEEVGEFLAVEREDDFIFTRLGLHPPEIGHQPVADRPAGEDGLSPPGGKQVVGHHPEEVLSERSVLKGLERLVESVDVHDQDLAFLGRDARAGEKLEMSEDMRESDDVSGTADAQDVRRSLRAVFADLERARNDQICIASRG